MTARITDLALPKGIAAVLFSLCLLVASVYLVPIWYKHSCLRFVAAAGNGDIATVRRYVYIGFPPNTCDLTGRTAIGHAAIFG
jgi:hypothetical protein